MKITYKETKDLDYEKVVDIFYEANFLKHAEKRKTYSKRIEMAFRNSQYVVSAYDEDELIGFARVVTDQILFATIWNMIVKTEYQKRGIGKLMVQRCLKKFPKCHFFLFASDKVVNFYRKSGFDIHQFGMYLKEGLKKSIIYN